MARRVAQPAGLMLAVLVGACAPIASGSPVVSPKASTAPAGSAGATTAPASTTGIRPTGPTATPVAVGPWPTIEPSLVLDDRLACSPDPGAPSFTSTAFNQAEPVDMTSDDPAVRALRSAMTDGTPALLGWRRIPTTLASVLLFVARGTSPGTWTQAVLRAQPGSPPWRLVTIGECRVQIVPPDGISLAELWLDANRLPQPADRTIRVLVIEMACASGQSAAGRIRAPQLAYRTDSVIALVTVTRQPGGQDCQGNPPAPFDLTLAEPLGSRVLRNGAFLPPPEVRP